MIDFHSQLSIIPVGYESATLQDNLEHSGGITLSWKAASDAEISLGAYITYGGVRYILLETYAPTKESAIHWHYNPIFKHPQNMLDRIPFWIKSLDASGNPINLQTTSFTGYPHTIVQKLVDFINSEYVTETGDLFFASTMGSNWSFDIPSSLNNNGVIQSSNVIITVPFDGCSIKSAANSIADAMGCNVFFDWSAKVIRFVVGSTIQGEAYNCFHVLGGTKNMGKTTTSGGFTAVTQRLTLPDTYKGSIISLASANGIRLTTDLIFDEIYPKQELYIKSARQRLCYLTDNETGEFIVDHWEKDGQTVPQGTPGAIAVLKKFAKWYITLATDRTLQTEYVFDEQYLIKDKPLGILFQLDYEHPENMSPLVGQEFELTYFPEAKSEYDRNDAVATAEHPFEIAAHEYFIALSAHGEILLPTVSNIINEQETGLVPRIGDKITLVNMALNDTQKDLAKQELLAAAQEIIAAMTASAGEYTETILDGQGIVIGQASPFSGHGPVVTTVNLNLDTNVCEVTVGSWSRKTKTGGTVDKLETVTVSASDPTTGGEGGLGGNSSNAIGQTLLKPDSLFAASLSNSIDVVACDAEGKVKVATDIYTRIDCRYGTKNVTSACTVAVPSLPPSQDSGTAGSPLTIDIYVTDKASSETKITLIDHSYDLDENKRWLRIHFPQGYDLSQLDYALEQTFNIEHPAYTERSLHFTAQSMRPGVNGIGGPFKSRAFCRTNEDLSGVQPTGGSFTNPLPGNSSTHKETYTIGGKQVEVTWSDGVPQGDAKLWSTVRTFYLDATVSSWSNPAQETDTDTQDIEFSPNTTQPNNPTGDPFTNRESQGWYDPKSPNFAGKTMIWRAERKVKNGQWEAGGDWVITRIYGEKGNNGGNTATIYLYKRVSGTAPGTTGITITLYYDFESKLLFIHDTQSGKPVIFPLDESNCVQYSNGWSPKIPNGSDPLYVTAAIAYSTGRQDDILSSEWVTPAKMSEDGAHGINTAPIFLYQRYAPTEQAPLPAKPTSTVYYKFDNGKLYTSNALTTEVTYPLNGWYRSIPDSNGNPCFVIQAAALGNGEYDDIQTSEWSDVRKLVEDGKDGNSVTYDDNNSSISYAYSSMGSPEAGRDYPSDITSWSSSIPAVQKGKYLWRRDITAYKNSDGSSAGTTTTYGVEYQPNDGESVEIDTNRTFIKYCKQTASQYTGQHPDDNQFSTTYPSDLAKGDYLWILNQLAYVGVTNPLKSYSVSMLGTDGTNGDPGADGYTTHFAYATSADGSQNFSTTSFAGATYIGTYRDQNGPDSLDYRDYTWTQWKGDKGDNGTSIMKSSADTYRYATNNTGVRPDASSQDWSTTKPTLQVGYWLYTETTIHWSDGTTTVLYSDERNPNDGVAGMDIVAGTTTVTYCVKDSNSPQPADSEFHAYNPSEVVSGKWLWSKAITPYYKGSTSGASAGSSSTYSVSYIGTNGTNGKDGKDGTNGTNGRAVTGVSEHYNISDSSSTQWNVPSSGTWAGEWSDNPNQSGWGANNKYLWNYEKIIYTESDGSTTINRTTPSVIAVFAEDGNPGRGIDSVVNKYCVTNDSTIPVKEGHTGAPTWYNTPQVPGQGQYLWNYEVINWINPTSSTSTDVQLLGYVGTNGTNGTNGRDGTDGQNGADAYSVVIEPADMLFTQSTTKDENDNYPLVEATKYAAITVKKGNSNSAVAHITAIIGTPSGCTATANGDTITVNGVIGNYTEGSVTVRVSITDGPTFDLKLNVYYNLLGTWKESVDAGVETIAAEKVEHMVDGGVLVGTETYNYDSTRSAVGAFETFKSNYESGGQSINNLNSRVSTAEGNISTVSKRVDNGINLLDGALTGNNWKSYSGSGSTLNDITRVQNNNIYINSGDRYIVSPAFNIERGEKYTVSFDIPGYIGSGTAITLKLVSADNVQTVFATLTTNTSGRRYVSFEASVSGSMRIMFDGLEFIHYPQLELGDTATSFDAGTTEITSQIKQTADEIRLQVGECGLDITNGAIVAKGGKFKMQDENGNDTFVLDTNGNLESQGSAKFEGTVSAKLFFAAVKMVEKSSDDVRVNLVDDPYYTYYVPSPGTPRAIILPEPNSGNEGVELRFISPILDGVSGPAKLVCANKIMSCATGQFANVSELILKVNRFITVKSMNNLWWIVSGFE